MTVNQYSIDAQTIFEDGVPKNYPKSISDDHVDVILNKRVDEIIRKARQLNYPFLTIVIAELGDSKIYRVFEGTFFLKYTMLFLEINKCPSIKGQLMTNPHFYALNISEDKQVVFKPFLENFILECLENFKDIKSRNNLIRFINAFNVSIEEELTKKTYAGILEKLLDSIPKNEKEDKLNLDCLQLQIKKLMIK